MADDRLGKGPFVASRSDQPGGRAPAPGRLALVQAFLNSHFSLGEDHGADLFASPSSLRNWLRARDLIAPAAPIGPSELSRAVQIREGLRSLADGRPAPSAFDVACVRAAVELRFDEDAPRFVLGGSGTLEDACGLVLGIAAAAMIDGQWPRLKICPGQDCGWAFYDGSRNRSGRWCSMSVCGGRAKAQTHYRRQQRAAP